MELIQRKIADLKLDPDNARQHDERNLNAIQASLEGFGQVENLVIQKGTDKVIGGNGRLEALRRMGVKVVQCVEVDCTDDEAQALSVALNRTGELATWDEKQLAKTLGAIAKRDPLQALRTGFDEREIKTLLAKLTAPEPSGGPKGKTNVDVTITCPHCNNKFKRP